MHSIQVVSLQPFGPDAMLPSRGRGGRLEATWRTWIDAFRGQSPDKPLRVRALDAAVQGGLAWRARLGPQELAALRALEAPLDRRQQALLEVTLHFDKRIDQNRSLLRRGRGPTAPRVIFRDPFR